MLAPAPPRPACLSLPCSDEDEPKVGLEPAAAGSEDEEEEEAAPPAAKAKGKKEKKKGGGGGGAAGFAALMALEEGGSGAEEEEEEEEEAEEAASPKVRLRVRRGWGAAEERPAGWGSGEPASGSALRLNWGMALQAGRGGARAPGLSSCCAGGGAGAVAPRAQAIRWKTALAANAGRQGQGAAGGRDSVGGSAPQGRPAARGHARRRRQQHRPGAPGCLSCGTLNLSLGVPLRCPKHGVGGGVRSKADSTVEGRGGAERGSAARPAASGCLAKHIQVCLPACPAQVVTNAPNVEEGMKVVFAVSSAKESAAGCWGVPLQCC